MSNQNTIQVIVSGDENINMNFPVMKNVLTFANVSRIIKDHEPTYEFTLRRSLATFRGNGRKLVKYDTISDVWLNSDDEDIRSLDISHLEIIVNATQKPKETPSSNIEPYLQEAAHLSKEVYNVFANEANLVDTLKRQHKFSTIIVGKHSKQKFIIAKSGRSNTIYLAMPGINNLQEVEDSVNFLHSEVCFGDCRVHSGFYERAKSIPIIGIYKYFYSQFKEKDEKFSFIICGHSLGGAVAQILTIILLTYLQRTNSVDEKFVNIYSISFGAPYWVNKNNLEGNVIGPSRRLLKDFLVNIIVEDDVIVHILNFEFISRLQATTDEFKQSLQNIVAKVKGCTVESITQKAADLLAYFPDSMKSLGVDKLAFAIAKEVAFYTPVGKYFTFVNNSLKELSPVELQMSIEIVSKRPIGDFKAIHGIENYVTKIHNLNLSLTIKLSNRTNDMGNAISSLAASASTAASSAASAIFRNNSIDLDQGEYSPNEQLGIDVDVCFNNGCLVEVYDIEDRETGKTKKKIVVMFDSIAASIIAVQIHLRDVKELKNWINLTPCGCYHEYPIENDRENKYRVSFEVLLDDSHIDFVHCKCQVKILSPFRRFDDSFKVHIARASEKHKYSFRQLQTAWFMLMTCSDQEYKSSEMQMLKGYLEMLEEISLQSPSDHLNKQRFRESFEKRDQICQNSDSFMKECSSVSSYTYHISKIFVLSNLTLNTKKQKRKQQIKTAAIIFGVVLSLATIGTGIGAAVAASAIGVSGTVAAVAGSLAGVEIVAVEIATLQASLVASTGILGGTALVSFLGASAITVFDNVVGEAYEQKLLFFIEVFGGKRFLKNDVALLEEELCKTIFGDYKDNEIPDLNHVLNRIDKFKFKEDYCTQSLNDIRLTAKVYVALIHIRAFLRNYKIITVLGKKNSGKTTYLKRLFEQNGFHEVANSLKTGVDSTGATRFCTSYIIIPRANDTKLCVIDTPGIGDVSQMSGSVTDGKRASPLSNIFLQLDCLVIVTFGKSCELDTRTAFDILIRQQPKDYCIFGNQIDNCLDEIDKSYPEYGDLQVKLNAHKEFVIGKYNEQLKKDYEANKDIPVPEILVKKFHFTSFLPEHELRADLNKNYPNIQKIPFLDANQAIQECLRSTSKSLI